MGRADLKTEAIERIDELIIGPMLAGLAALGEFAILLMPDHPTPCKLKTHSNEPVPFAILTSRAGGDRAWRAPAARGATPRPTRPEPECWCATDIVLSNRSLAAGSCPRARAEGVIPNGTKSRP